MRRKFSSFTSIMTLFNTIKLYLGACRGIAGMMLMLAFFCHSANAQYYFGFQLPLNESYYCVQTWAGARSCNGAPTTMELMPNGYCNVTNTSETSYHIVSIWVDPVDRTVRCGQASVGQDPGTGFQNYLCASDYLDTINACEFAEIDLSQAMNNYCYVTNITNGTNVTYTSYMYSYYVQLPLSNGTKPACSELLYQKILGENPTSGGGGVPSSASSIFPGSMSSRLLSLGPAIGMSWSLLFYGCLTNY